MSARVVVSRQLHNKAVLGVSLMMLGLALYPLSDAFIKHLMGTYSVPQASFLRAFTRLIPLLIMMYFQGGIRKVLWTKCPGKHAIRLLVNLGYTLSFMYAFSMVSLTTIYTLSYTSSLFMTMLSAFMLKESVTWDRWGAVGVGLIGVIIAMRPGAGVFEIASIIVLGGTFLGALNKILMRRLAETEHTIAITIYPNIMMILVTMPFLITTWKSMPWEHWRLFSIVGVITAGAQYAIAQALRFAQGSVLATVDSSYFWVVVYDFFWWNKIPDSYMITGAAIIIASNMYILYRTRKTQALKKESTASYTTLG